MGRDQAEERELNLFVPQGLEKNSGNDDVELWRNPSESRSLGIG